MKNITDQMDEAVCVIENEEEGNLGCQVRRKIEDYLEHRRYKEELGEPLLEGKK